MTEFVNENGDRLQYSGEDVTFTKQIASFRNFKIKGDITVSFKLNNNSQNRKALGYANVQQVGNHAFAPLAFSLIRNGNLAHKGFIVIEDDAGFGGDIGCYFVSGNSNWFKAFDFPMNKIRNDQLQIPFTTAGISGTVGKTYGIIYPLIDYLYYRKKFDPIFLDLTPVRGQGDTTGYMELYPCLYIHTLVQELAKTADIRIDGELMDDQFYNTLIMTPTGPDVPNSNTGLPLLQMVGTGWNYAVGFSPYVKIESIPDPNIKAIDFIKWLSFSFGCVPTFDEASQTLSLDFIDNIRRENAQDWTQYYDSHEVKYSDFSEHNFIKCKTPVEDEVKAYNLINNIPLGEANIRTKKTDGSENTLYTSPFAPAKDQLGDSPLFWATPFIQFLKLTDGKQLSYTAVTNVGGFASFTVDMSSSGEIGDQPASLVFRVLDDVGTYTGYHVAKGIILSTSMNSRGATFNGTSTGKIWLQKMSKQETGNRILSCIPTVPYNNVMTQLPGLTAAGNTLSNVASAYYSKPIYPYGSLNNYQKSLSYGEINITTYNDISLIESRWNKIQSFLRNAPIFMYFRLPESVFNQYDFKQFIYINHKDISGYFYPELIEGFKDGTSKIRALMNYLDGYTALTGYTTQGQKLGYPEVDGTGRAPGYNPAIDYDIFDFMAQETLPIMYLSASIVTSFGSLVAAEYQFDTDGIDFSQSLNYSNIPVNPRLTDTQVTSTVTKFSNSGLAEANGTIKWYQNSILVSTYSFINGEYLGGGKSYVFSSIANGDSFNVIMTEV